LTALAFAASACTHHARAPRADAPLTSLPTSPPAESPVVCAPSRVERPEQLASLAHCTVIDGDLVIANLRVTELAPLPELTEVRGMLDVSRNSQLKSLGGLHALARVGKLAIHDNPRLTRLDGLDAVVAVNHVLVARNPRLISLKALSSITQAKSIEVRQNPMLQGNSAEFFPALVRAEQLIVENNASISPGERRMLMERVVIAPPDPLVVHASR